MEMRQNMMKLLLIFVLKSLQAAQIDRPISEEFSQSTFTSQNAWTISNSISSPFTPCGKFGTLFGVFDFNTEITKTYSWINTPHFALQYDYKILKIDSWEVGDKVEVYLQNYLVQTVQSTPTEGVSNECGSAAYNEALFPFSHTISHRGDSLTVKFVGYFDDSEESFGLREIFLSLKMCDISCASCSGPENDKCDSCYANSVLSGGTCSCAKYYFRHDNYSPASVCDAEPCSSCLRCDITCATCDGPLPTNCLSCDPPDSLVGSQCQAPKNAYIIETTFKSKPIPESEITSWIVTKYIIIKQSTCDTYTLFGGENIFGKGLAIQRYYPKAPPHYAMRLKLLFLKIDSWENEGFEISIDRKTILKTFNSQLEPSISGNLCGSPCFEEFVYTVSEYFTKTTSNFLVITIKTNIASDVEQWWGISNVEVTLYACDYSCKTCTDYDKCLSCHYGSTYSNEKCICSDGYFMFKQNICTTSDSPCSECRICDSNCLTCSYTATNCLTCAAGKFLTATKVCVNLCQIPTWGDYGSSSCVDTCPNVNQFGDPIDRICKSCNLNCKTCVSTADHCLSCESPLYYHSATFNCVADCPAPLINNDITRNCDTNCPNTNQYYDSALKKCVDCNAICRTCETSSLNCLSCGVPKYLNLNTCLDECPVPTWGDTISRTCVSVCPGSDEFGDVSNTRICAKCDPNCKTCAITAQTCNSCLNSYFLENNLKKCYLICPEPLWGSSDTMLCEAVCKNNEYGDKMDFRKCKSCDGNCLTCKDTANTCTSCSFPRYLNANSCEMSCYSPFWGNNSTRTCDSLCLNANEFGDITDNRICKLCSGTCKTCVDQSSKCTSCLDLNRYLTSSNTCELCDPNCLTCSTSAISCQSCAFPNFLEASKALCVLECPGPNLWGDPVTRTCSLSCGPDEFGDVANSRVCAKCDLNCKTCQNTASSCTSCNPPFYLDESSKNCVSSCLPLTYLYQSSCVIQCPDGYFGSKIEGKCLKQCAQTQYGDPIAKTCKICPSPCKNCFLVSGKVCCKDCYETHFYDENTKDCVIVCPEPRAGNMTEKKCSNYCEAGYFIGKTNRICTKCANTCKTCEETETNCSSCESPMYLYQKTGSCLETCPEKLMPNNQTQTCQGCMNFCAECDGLDTCKECQLGYFLNLKTMSCSRCEKANSNIVGRLCVECGENCEECSREGFCIKCLAEYVLTDVNTCSSVLILNPVLMESNFPGVLKIDFKSKQAPLFVAKLGSSPTNIFQFKFEPKGNDNFHFIIRDVSDSGFFFQFFFKENITAGTLVTLEIIPQPWMKEFATITLKNFSFNARVSSNIILCSESHQAPGKANDTCLDLTPVTPSLALSDELQILCLSFDEDFTDLFDILDKATHLDIEGIGPEYFGFRFLEKGKEATKRKFLLHVSFNMSMVKTPLVKLSFKNLPLKIVYHDVYALSKTNLTIRMRSYFRGMPTNSDEIKDNKKSTATANDIVITSTYVSSFASAGSSFAFRSLLLMDLIKFLRFVDINYPENALSVFEAQLELIPFWPKLNLEKEANDPDPEGKFLVYEVSPYLINNIGPALSQTAFVFLLAIIFKYVKINPKFLVKQKALAILIYSVQRMLTWNFVLVLLLSNFQNICVYTFVSLRWQSWQSPLGVFNGVFAFFSLVGIFWLIYFIYLRVKFLRIDFNGETPRVIPMLPPLLKQGVLHPLNKVGTVFMDDFQGETERKLQTKSSATTSSADKTKQSGLSIVSENKSITLYDLEHAHTLLPSNTQELPDFPKPINEQTSLNRIRDDNATASGTISHQGAPGIEKTSMEISAINDIKPGMYNKRTISERFFDKVKLPESATKEEAVNNTPTQVMIKSQSQLSNVPTSNILSDGYKNENLGKENGTDSTVNKGNRVRLEPLGGCKSLNAENFTGLEKPNTLLNTQTYSDEAEEEYQRSKKKEMSYKAAGNLKRDSETKKPSRHRKDSSNDKNDGIIRRLSNKIIQRFSFTNSSKTNEVKAIRSRTSLSAPNEKNDGLLRRISATIKEQSNVFFNKSHRAEFRMNYLILYKDFKQEKSRYSYYIVFNLIRCLTLSAVFVLAYRYPFQQMITLLVINVAFFVYFLLVRPFKNLKDTLVNTLNEGALCVCCISCLYMAHMDRTGDEDHVKRFRAGAVIFYINMMLIFLFLLLFLLELLALLRDCFVYLFRKIRGKSIGSQSRKSWKESVSKKGSCVED